MRRKCFIIGEPLPYEGISTRKLLLETAYYNVITAYSTAELLDTISVFPNVDAVVVHSELMRNQREKLKDIREALGSKPLYLLSTNDHESSAVADEVLSSYDPQLLLASLRDRFGKESQQGTNAKA